MRRLISTTLLATVLLGAAACGAKAEENPTAATTPSPTVAAVATVDKATTCAALTKDLDALKLQALTYASAVLDAIGDPSKQAKAMQEGRTMLTLMQTAGEKHLATAGDPELKAALTTFVEQVKAQRAALEAAGDNFDKFADVEDKGLEEAGDKLEALCK